MTKKQKEKQIIGIVFLVLSVLCAGLYVWLSSPATWTGFIGDLAEAGKESEIPFADLVFGTTSELALGAADLLAALCALLLAVLGWILSLGTTLLSANLPWKIAGGVGMLLHVVLLVMCIVGNLELFRALITF